MVKPERLVLLVPEGLQRQAKAKASLEGTSVSAVVRAWLKAWVNGDLELLREEPDDDRPGGAGGGP